MAVSRDGRVRFDIPVAKVYDAFFGRFGRTETKLRQTFRNSASSFFMPGTQSDVKPTVMIDQFFLVNGANEFCTLDDVEEDSKVFLHGNVSPWSSRSPTWSIGNARVLEWFVKIEYSLMFSRFSNVTCQN